MCLKIFIYSPFKSPRQVLAQYVRKSAELAKAILTTINSAIKKEPIKGSLLMAGTTRLSWPVRIKRVYGFSFQKLRFFQRKVLRTLLTGRSNSGRFKTTCGEFSPLMRSAIWQWKKQTLKVCFLLLMAGTTRLELATSCVTGMRSNQLSYAPIFNCHHNHLIRLPI